MRLISFLIKENNCQTKNIKSQFSSSGKTTAQFKDSWNFRGSQNHKLPVLSILNLQFSLDNFWISPISMHWQNPLDIEDSEVNCSTVSSLPMQKIGRQSSLILSHLKNKNWNSFFLLSFYFLPNAGVDLFNGLFAPTSSPPEKWWEYRKRET